MAWYVEINPSWVTQSTISISITSLATCLISFEFHEQNYLFSKNQFTSMYVTPFGNTPNNVWLVNLKHNSIRERDCHKAIKGKFFSEGAVEMLKHHHTNLIFSWNFYFLYNTYSFQWKYYDWILETIRIIGNTPNTYL